MPYFFDQKGVVLICDTDITRVVQQSHKVFLQQKSFQDNMYLQSVNKVKNLIIMTILFVLK